MFAALALAALSLSQTQPGSIADQATRPLWVVAEEGGTLAAIDRGPASATPAGPEDVTFWLFVGDQGGYDTMAAAITVDCGDRSFVHRSFAAFQGPAFVGAAAAQDTSRQTAEPDTYYGAVVAHVCDPSADSGRAADYADFLAVAAARAGRATE